MVLADQEAEAVAEARLAVVVAIVSIRGSLVLIIAYQRLTMHVPRSLKINASG